MHAALRIPREGWNLPLPETEVVLGSDLGERLIALAHRHKRPIRELPRGLLLKAYREVCGEMP